MENDKIAMGAGMFLLVAIGAFLIIPMSQERTLILTTRDDSTPVSCLDDDKLILAQNLTDLCDVVIISPSTNQTLVYNGTYWVNTNQVIFNDTSTCQNIGNGSAFICVEGTNIDFRSILAGSGISVSNSSDTITIVNTLPEATSGSNLGTYGQGVFSSEVGNDLQFKKILAGTSITVTSNSTNVIITNSKPEQGCTSAGGTSIWKTTTTCDAKGLTAGVGLTLTSNTNDNNYKTNFVNGTGISITGTTSQTFTNTGVTSLTSADTDGLALSGSTGAITITPKWELLCQNSWSSGQSFSCSSFTARKHLHVEIIASHANAGTGVQTALQFNSDTGNNYADRISVNGAADSTGNTRANCRLGTAVDTESGAIYSVNIINIASKDKLSENYGVGFLTRAVNSAPSRLMSVCEWVNTTDQITTITVMANSGNDNYDSNAMITVWGYD